MILSTSELKPIANFAGLQAQQDASSAAAALHPTRRDELLLAVPPSLLQAADGSSPKSKPFLQTFDTMNSRHISRQALTRNNITDFNIGPEGNKIRMPNVSLLQLSHDGEWMATVEEWKPPVTDAEFLAANEQMNEEQRQVRREIYLKIWQWSTVRNSWVLESRIDNPHPFNDESKPGRVLSLIADPAETGFATLGEDGCVRIWKPKTRLRNGIVVRGSSTEGLVDWTCRHLVQMEQDWDQGESQGRTPSSVVPTSASLAYSDDGSVLAASQVFEGKGAVPTVHFIQTESGEIAQSRPGIYTGNISALGFLNRYLTILSTTSLSVWDVVTETLSYRIDLAKSEVPDNRVFLLSISRADNTIAISIPTQQDSTPATSIQIFSPESSKPAYSHVYPHIITAMLTVPTRKGYTLLTTEAEILHLSSNISLAIPATVGPTSTTISTVPVTEEQEDETMTDASIGEKQQQLVVDVDDPDSERPVVRPEQLARVFDAVGHNAASVPVRAMFEAVVDLFGRRNAGQQVVV